MKTNYLAFIAVTSLTSVLAVNANAQGYIGASVGITTPDDSGFDDDSGFKLSGGYKLSKNVEVQASYVDLGEFEADSGTVSALNSVVAGIDLTALGLGPGDTATITAASAEISGFELAAIGLLPLSEQVELFGKLGAFIWDADVNADVTINFAGGGTSSATGTESDDGTDLSFGFGINFYASENIVVSAEVSRYDALDDDTDYLGMGLKYLLKQQ